MNTYPTLSIPLGLGLPRLGPWWQVHAPQTLVERTLDSLRSLARSATSSGSNGSGGGTVAGDTEASPGASITMEQLVHEHADAVYRVALSVTRNPVLAEDASQDTLIKAWQSLPSYRGDAPLRHWILRIAHNTSISLLRKRREDVMSPLDMPERSSAADSVETAVQDRIAIDRFESALSELDGISRSIVVLREVEGLSYGEMSDVLELPLPTIRTRLLRARRQLADALDGWQP